ncbi:hypothetical protein WG66_008214 [Moniliophthora roreri]|nr:hypothetical protein WG66_008214 [Moniliophthora roreri]
MRSDDNSRPFPGTLRVQLATSLGKGPNRSILSEEVHIFVRRIHKSKNRVDPNTRVDLSESLHQVLIVMTVDKQKLQYVRFLLHSNNILNLSGEVTSEEFAVSRLEDNINGLTTIFYS